MFDFKLKSFFAFSGVAIVAVLIYLTGFTATAQRGKAVRLRCTPMELAGVKSYDIVKKKIIGMRRKVVINRCETEDVICFHSFDQGGTLSCVKR